MTCLTGGLTPCGAATGIPGRPATSSSPTCRARAVLTKASPGTPWSTARPMAAAQPGTGHATTRPTRRPPTPPGSQAGSHRHPTQGDPEPTEAFDITAITSHPATAADTSQLAGSRSHRGSALSSTPPPHAKVPFQRCALRHLTHMPKSARLPCAYPFTRRNSHSGSLDLAGDFRERPFPIITMENQVAESTWGDRACSSSPPALRMRGSAVQLPHKVPAGTRGLERDSAAWGGVADSLYECGVGGSGFAGQAGIGRAGFSTRLSRGGFWRLPRCGWRRRAWRMCSPGACGRCRVRARAGGRSPG